MHLFQRASPRGPVFACDQRRVGPFRQLRRAGQRTARRLDHCLLRHPLGQRVDRLVAGQFGRLRRQKDMIRVDHLRDPVEQFGLARHQPPLAHRQLPLQPVLSRMEEHKAERHFGV